VTHTVFRSLIDEADRLWDAAWTLDELRGDTAASAWTARKVRALIRDGQADNPAKVGELADVLERRVARGSDSDAGAA